MYEELIYERATGVYLMRVVGQRKQGVMKLRLFPLCAGMTRVRDVDILLSTF
jgi:hypothetical protein